MATLAGGKKGVGTGPSPKKPSAEEIARLRAEAAELKVAAPPTTKAKAATKGPANTEAPTKKKERDPEREAAELQAFGVGAAVVDIGANLQGRNSFDEVARLLDRAALAGVTHVVLTGCDVQGSRKGNDYCERWWKKRRQEEQEAGTAFRPTVKLFCTAGVHPHDATTFDEATLCELRALAASPHCVALGECGLDYDRMFSPRETQVAAFEAQATLARDLGMPLFVHCREVDEGKEFLGAYADAVGVLRKVGLAPENVVVHCFTGDETELAAVRDFGAKVGFTGFLGIAKRAGKTIGALRSLGGAAALRAGALMIETDAPFMLPDKTYLPAAVSKRLGVRGGKSEPALTPSVARALADALSTETDHVTPEEVAARTTEAAAAFFRFNDADAELLRKGLPPA